jgi:hypothetical protein
MLGSGAENQQRQPVALRVDCRVAHLLAYSFQPAKVVVLAEQSLSEPALFSVGEQDYPDLFQLYLSGLGGLVRRRFVSFHAADLRKFEGKCPAKSALALFFLLQWVFMHTRCRAQLRRVSTFTLP